MWQPPQDEQIDNSPSNWKPPEDEAIDSQPQQPKEADFKTGLLSQISNAVKNSPLGMATQGVESMGEGINKALDVTGIPVSPSIQSGAQSLFRGSRALGVGGAEYATGQSPMNTTMKTMNAFQPGYEPQGLVEKAGSFIGENAPVIAAGIASPTIGGPLAMAAQQAQTGKVSPLPAALAMAKPILGGAKLGAKKLFGNTFGVTGEAIDARLKNPESIRNAQDFPDLANKLPDSLNNLSNQISKAEGEAYNKLGTTPEAGGIPKNSIMGIINKIQQERGPAISDEEVSAYQALDRLQKRITNSPDVLSELDVKDMLKQLNKTINYRNPNAGATNDVLKSFKGQLNEVLKTQNPAYAEAMKPVEELTGLHGDIVKQFKLGYEPNQGYVGSDSTARALGNLNGPYKSNAQDVLGRLGQATGEDLVGETKASKLAKQFQSKPILGSAGSRRTLAGGAIGGAIGHFTGSPYLGSAIGAGTGALLDAEGGPMAGKILDVASKVPEVNPTAIQKVTPTLTKTWTPEKEKRLQELRKKHKNAQ